MVPRMGSVTATTVSGRNRQGSWTELSIGDTISGYTYGGVLVTGTITEIAPGGVHVTGITGYGQEGLTRGSWTVQVQDVLTHVRHD